MQYVELHIWISLVNLLYQIKKPHLTNSPSAVSHTGQKDIFQSRIWGRQQENHETELFVLLSGMQYNSTQAYT